MASARSFLFPYLTDVPAVHWDGDLAADVFADCGTSVLAPFDGDARPQNFALGGFTNRVVADDGTEFYVAHLLDEGRVRGRVSAGQAIGYVSDSGNAKGKGCHAHIAVGSINSNGGGTIRPRDFYAGAVPGQSPAPASPLPPTSPSGQPGGIPKWLLLLAGGLLALEFLDD
jgi:murein DD-endopeptidase MepM/ murein hydrolase activator NlpD